MGAQQVKERAAGSLGAGTSLRASRIKSRGPKDAKTIGSNIFTEHSGKSNYKLQLRNYIMYK